MTNKSINTTAVVGTIILKPLVEGWQRWQLWTKHSDGGTLYRAHYKTFQHAKNAALVNYGFDLPMEVK